MVLTTPYSIVVPLAGLRAWLDGTPVQAALPTVPKEEREFLVSGISPDGFRTLYPPDDDDEDEDAGAGG